jgi:hypothetical protein
MTQRKPIPLALLYAGIATLGMIVVTLGTYKAGPVSFLKLTVDWMYLIPLACGVIAALVRRKRQGGYLEFRNALRIIFGILVLAVALQGVFTWLLVNVIDPHFGEALRPVWLANTEAAYRRFGMPDDEVRRNIDSLKNTNPFSLGSIMLGLARVYIVGFLITLILAAIVKRKKPVERQTTL